MKEKKRVLIITYYWPPAGGVSVLRCLKFAKYLRNFGWEPVIFTAENPNYPFLDYGNEKDIPEGIEILKGPIWDPIPFFKKLTGRKASDPLQNIIQSSGKKRSFLDVLGIFIRGNFFIPDARVAWIRPSVRRLKKYLKENPVDAIFSDGPTHTNTVIAMRLAQATGTPWLADFQDPWTQADYYTRMYITPPAHWLHSRLEQQVFKTAKKISIASPSWKKDLESIGAKNVSVLYYGFDESDFSDYRIQKAEKFSIFHAGLIGNDRNPKVLFAALDSLFKRRPELRTKIELVFAGEVDYSIFDSISHYGLDDNLRFMGLLSRAEVRTEYSRSGWLLLPINQADNAAGRIPGKFYEYMRTTIPIIAFGPKSGDVKSIMEKHHLGSYFTYDANMDIVEQELESRFDQWDAGKVSLKTEDVQMFSNENQTKALAGWLDEISNAEVAINQ